MTVTVNNSNLDLETSNRSLGEILTELDEAAERAGQVIVAIRLNSQDLAAEQIPAMAAHDCRAEDRLDIQTSPIRFMRIEAISTLLGLIEASQKASLGAGSEAERQTVAANSVEFRDRYSGLFSAEENSFVDSLVQTLQAGGAATENLAKIQSFFRERVSEAENPLQAMRSANQLFTALLPDLNQVAVRLQTGKDAEAMRTMVLVVELINKTVRVLPDFIGALANGEDLRIAGESVQDFYQGFNTVLRELMDAFENKDSVLIGDLAEYEILPRMTSFFGALQSSYQEA